MLVSYEDIHINLTKAISAVLLHRTGLNLFMLTYEKCIVFAGLQLFFAPYFPSTKLKMNFANNHKPFLSVSPEKSKPVQGFADIRNHKLY